MLARCHSPPPREVTSLSLWVWSLGGRSAALVLATLNLVIIARALGPYGRGQYFLFGSIVLTLTMIADLGLTQAALAYGGRSGVGAGRVHRTLLRHALVLSLATCAAAALVLGLAGEALVPNMPRAWLLGATVAVPATVYVSYWSAMMVSLRRVRTVNAIQIGVGALTLCANLLLVATTGDAAVAIAIYVLNFAVQATAMFTLRPQSDAQEEPTIERAGRLGPEMLRFGLRGYPSALGSLIWSRAPAFVLNALQGPEAVGVYSIAQQLAERALLPVQSFQDVLYNRMIRLPQGEAIDNLNRFLRIGIALMVPLLVVAFLLSGTIITVLFSEAFQRSVDVLHLLLIGSAAIVVPALLSTFFLAHRRRPGLLAILSWANGLLTVILLLSLVPEYAERGAAVATLTSQILAAAVMVALYLRATHTVLAVACVPRRADLEDVREQVRAILRRLGAPPEGS